MNTAIEHVGKIKTPEAHPVPPRCWWLKRICVAIALLLVALPCWHWLWGVAAERYLRARIEKYRAAGHPVLPEDFAQPSVSDEENAAYHLEQAAEVFVWSGNSAQLDFEDITYHPPFVVEYPDLADQAVARHAQVLGLIRQSRQAPNCNWGNLPSIQTLTGWLSTGRYLVKLACASAIVCHVQGHDAEAMEALRDALSIAENTHKRGYLISYLVAVGMEATVISTVQYVVPALTVVASSEGSKSPESARQGDVEKLIRFFLNDERQAAAWRHAVITDGTLTIDFARELCEGRDWKGRQTPAAAVLTRPWYAPAVRTVLTPRWRHQAAYLLDSVPVLAELGNESWPEVQRIIPQPPEGKSGRPRSELQAVLEPLRVEAFHRPYEQHVQLMTRRRMAAIALAVRLYEVEHGARPASLDELVPEYLPAVPRDPFAPDGLGIHYVPQAETPMLYSVGPNGLDEKGERERDATAEQEGGKDDVRFLLNREDIKTSPFHFDPSTVTTPSDESVEDEP